MSYDGDGLDTQRKRESSERGQGIVEDTENMIDHINIAFIFILSDCVN